MPSSTLLLRASTIRLDVSYPFFRILKTCCCNSKITWFPMLYSVYAFARLNESCTCISPPPSMIPNRTLSFLFGVQRCYVRQYSVSRFPVQERKPPASEAIVSIGSASVYPLGSSSTKGSAPLLREFQLVINEGEAWAVVGTSGAGKDALLQVSTYQDLECLHVTEPRL